MVIWNFVGVNKMKKTFCLFSDGELSRQNNTLCFQTKEGKRFLPVENVNEIFIFGQITFNKELLELLSRYEIIIHYFNYYGYYMGSFYPREHLNSGYIILKQAQFYLNQDLRLDIARRFVNGAERNILRVLKYYQARQKNVIDIIQKIEMVGDEIPNANNIQSLMALEGKIHEFYYAAFDLIIDKPEFNFEVRTRRPPKNELNTLISFGNSLIYTICLSEIYKTHLDPRIGFLHETNYRRFSLNLDIAEIFKPIIVDRIIFSLISKGIINSGDFIKNTEGLLMSEKAKKAFISELDEKLTTTINYRSIGHPISYRRLIRLELYKLEKHIMGEKLYQPFIAQW